ncbi:hypothetical protein Mal64_02740 [Pseudobythopirellula maris]|uniref:RedB protein n=1 Tax=Pseudobythopirellula maris TaxID=2527991 RepID=A0A5C5ZQR1_9BACT|nr:hypothetical protein [Pseudobythopirellula maris]TWT89892.1 hypothetical protein Mal64_02740 [Pseudobythopirellula maris]
MRFILIPTILTLWAVALGWQYQVMLAYGYAAEAADAYAKAWRPHSAIALDASRQTLLFFVHPKCPCTRASVAELRKVLAGSDSPPAVRVIATIPREISPSDEAWRNTPTRRDLLALPGAEVFEDVGGVEASRFGVSTSGAVLLFSPEGTRLFGGGVTLSRGHEGDNIGAKWLGKAIAHDARYPVSHTAPVFGCRLCLAPEAEEREGGYRQTAMIEQPPRKVNGQ